MGYKVYYYVNSQNKKVPVEDYIESHSLKDQAKIFKFIEFLQDNDGYLDEPYSKHIIDKIRELRVDFFHNKHRILYFAFVGKKIILLHAFSKHTAKTPKQEIERVKNNYYDFINNQNF
ncbi:type II toxin-antitoxin system RelE/ParE family toxin [Candidatus Parcubacteria bacterium]|nr:type II toxin-antitoxin system RelE/ParE family toxin [Candidatus Parcubacteria bacterium]